MAGASGASDINVDSCDCCGHAHNLSRCCCRAQPTKPTVFPSRWYPGKLIYMCGHIGELRWQPCSLAAACSFKPKLGPHAASTHIPRYDFESEWLRGSIIRGLIQSFKAHRWCIMPWNYECVMRQLVCDANTRRYPVPRNPATCLYVTQIPYTAKATHKIYFPDI